MSTRKNQLLGLLNEASFASLAPFLEQLRLAQGQVLHEAMQPIEYVYFLESGMSSEIALDQGGQRIEVGCVGNEGFVGVPVILGVPSTPHRSFMESDGSAQRIRAGRLLAACRDDGLLLQVLLRYVHVFMIQIAATALADGRYNVEQRTARWLLMSHDRLHGDQLPLTHEFLSLMLGVRRSSVTDALHRLEGAGVIKASRSLIVVRDRGKLEGLAGASYGVPEAEYQRVMEDFM
jgi:CRP-like cAMP-binding protein